MTNRILNIAFTFALAALLAQPAPAQSPPPATNPPRPSGPAGQTPPPRDPNSSGDKNVDALLDRLEIKGDAVAGITTRLDYNDVRLEPVEERVVKKGELLFRKGEPNSKFLIIFEETLAGGVRNANKEYYLFDGAWFTERNDRTKSVIRRQIVPTGKRIDPFKIGQGPFPLPFGQKRADIVRNFDVMTVAPAKDDPPGAIHLHCVPRPSSELSRQWRRLDMWIDQKLDLPVRIEVERVADENIIDVRFTAMDPNAAPAASRFDIGNVPRGFEVREEPLPDRPADPPGARR